MAYAQNTYFPFYTPQYYNSQQQAQQQMPMQQTIAQQPMQQMPIQSNGGLIWVDNEEQAKNYLVAPNNVVPMFDKGAPLLYIKSADGAGMPTFKKYKLNDFENGQGSQNNAAEHKCACAGKYATIDEFNDLRENFASLRKEFEEYKKGGAE